MRRADVYYQDALAGIQAELDSAYQFTYRPEYLAGSAARPISLTLPLRTEPYLFETLPAFFAGLLSEGTLRELQVRQFRIDPDDHFGLLLATAGQDVIGCVRVRPSSSP